MLQNPYDPQLKHTHQLLSICFNMRISMTTDSKHRHVIKFANFLINRFIFRVEGLFNNFAQSWWQTRSATGVKFQDNNILVWGIKYTKYDQKMSRNRAFESYEGETAAKEVNGIRTITTQRDNFPPNSVSISNWCQILKFKY